MARKQDKKEILRTAWIIATKGCTWPFVPEHPFAKSIGRKWAFDWSDPGRKLAIEIEGVVYRRGAKSRHQTAGGYEGDCEKYNAAIALGWRVLRYSPRMIERDPVGVIEQILDVADLCNGGRADD